MFTAFLENHPLADMLRDGSRELYPPAENRDAWNSVPDAYRHEIRTLAETYAGIPYPERSATGFLAFVRTGDRQADEKPYFTRRRKLCTAILHCCLFPDAPADTVVDGIWHLCEESSWVISAHNVNPIPGAPAPGDYPLPDIRKPYIDLFSAQTGMILSLAASLLGKKLDSVSPLIRERIREEIRRRILQPFMETDDFWWMGFRRRDLNNWTPWILSNIMVCSVLDPMPDGKLAEVLERACGMLDRWLEVVPADGGCDEGPGYWNMAGGALLDCLEILEKVTGGRMSFRQEAKVQHILRYPLAAALGNGWFANFSDCDARPFISGERLETAGRMLDDPALAAMGAKMRGTVADQLNDVPHLTRALDLLFNVPAEPLQCTGEQADAWLPDLQMRVVRRGEWVLACKGGHNGENHNHNDVGTFILMQGGSPAVVDAGNMVYTAKTFSAERYTLWNVQSGWHNLPVIGGCEQREGSEYAAKNAACTPDGLVLDLEAAYGPEAGAEMLRRSFRLSRNGLCLTDEGRLQAAQEVVWVFLLRDEPVWENGQITAGRLVIRCPEGMRFSKEEKKVTDPRMARSWPGSLWRVMLAGGITDRFRTDFTFTAREQGE